MSPLSKNWIVEPVFDYEYKTYQVLGYMQQVEAHFASHRLYPYLTELAGHLALLDAYESKKEALHDALRTELLKIDLKRLKMIRRGVEDESGVLDLLDEILAFAKERFDRVMKQGLETKEEVMKEINISPVGIMGADNSGGLLLFKKSGAARVYQYAFRMVRRPGTTDTHKDVVTRFLDEVTVGALPDFTAIKGRYLRRSDTPNQPNAYLVETTMPLPRFETVLPVVKEYLLTTIV